MGASKREVPNERFPTRGSQREVPNRKFPTGVSQREIPNGRFSAGGSLREVPYGIRPVIGGERSQVEPLCSLMQDRAPVFSLCSPAACRATPGTVTHSDAQ